MKKSNLVVHTSNVNNRERQESQKCEVSLDCTPRLSSQNNPPAPQCNVIYRDFQSTHMFPRLFTGACICQKKHLKWVESTVIHVNGYSGKEGASGDGLGTSAKLKEGRGRREGGEGKKGVGEKREGRKRGGERKRGMSKTNKTNEDLLIQFVCVEYSLYEPIFCSS